MVEKGARKKFDEKRKRQGVEPEFSEETFDETKRKAELENWVPKTVAGKLVKNGEITSIEQLWERNLPILEAEIISMLLPDLEEIVVDIKKTAIVKRAGRQFFFRASVLVGDGNQYIGIGTGTDRERLPAIKKASRKAKLNLVKVRKGCGSWECNCGTAHSIPFKVVGKAGSVKLTLLPAPKGAGLVVGKKIQDVMRLAGIRDVWGKARGNPSTTLNFVKAAVDALSKTTKMKVSKDIEKKIRESEI